MVIKLVTTSVGEYSIHVDDWKSWSYTLGAWGQGVRTWLSWDYEVSLMGTDDTAREFSPGESKELLREILRGILS